VDGLVFAVIAVAIVAVAAAAWQLEHRRGEAVRTLCLERGWEYRERDDGLVNHLAAFFPLFRAGHGKRRCRHVIRPLAAGSAPTFADYSYVERGTDGQGHSTERTVRHGVAVVELPGWLPGLRLGPETLLSRVGGAVGFGDIDVESPAFNRRFRVRARSRAHAFDILHPRAIEMLLAQPYDVWEMSGNLLLVARTGRWKLDEYGPAAVMIDAFVRQIPGYVWRKHGPETEHA
jgi:hypothetical protein